MQARPACARFRSARSDVAFARRSYDMTVAMWNTAAAGEPLARRWDHHTEFSVGLDASTLVDGLLTSAGWDEMAYVWPHQGDPRAA